MNEDISLRLGNDTIAQMEEIAAYDQIKVVEVVDLAIQQAYIDYLERREQNAVVGQRLKTKAYQQPIDGEIPFIFDICHSGDRFSTLVIDFRPTVTYIGFRR
jgi:hypothetical protein